MEFVKWSDFLKQMPGLGLTHSDLVLTAVLALAAPNQRAGFATTAEKYSVQAHGQLQASRDRRLQKPRTRIMGTKYEHTPNRKLQSLKQREVKQIFS